MKRCPRCGREYDNTMMFCLDDGAELLYGPARSEPGAIATGFPSDEPQTAFQERDWRMSVLMKTEPMLKPLRDDPRYKDLLKRMNLPD
ncbi:MAG TPA: hypothetical protein PLN05_07410 [Pyrinomonadaceae bacterium]|nr:hypothetical protein [Chloracidobacterium sp.]HBE84076.1 hypothetical protein [Blastocatellia bacterium]HRJ87781.1 hypothetical protein [Pyrinomonadaceae bacterium]HRK50237.1 hypothetical protein [Pyrinomonadaceae bacterium]